ncbi:miraculin [Capsicum galapagoense]
MKTILLFLFLAIIFLPLSTPFNQLLIGDVVDTNGEKIVVSSPVNIQFYLDYPLCSDLSVWKVDNLNSKLPHTISTGAKLGNPNDVSSWFQIMPICGDRKYKLVFCTSEEICQDIGVVLQGGYQRPKALCVQTG